MKNKLLFACLIAMIPALVLNGCIDTEGFEAVKSITLDKTIAVLFINAAAPGSNQMKLTATVNPASAADSLKWGTTNSLIAVVDQSGLVTAVGTGTAVIAVTTNRGNFSAVCVVTIEDAGGGNPVFVNGINLNHDNLTINLMYPPFTRNLIADISPPDATIRTVTWSSSDSAVAMVDQHGEVTCIGAGTADITAVTADGGYPATCTITVLNQYDPTIPPGAISVTTDGSVVNENDIFEIKRGNTQGFLVNADYAQNYEWTIDAPGQAFIRFPNNAVTSAEELVTILGIAAGDGTASVTVKAKNETGDAGAVIRNFKVKVNPVTPVIVVKYGSASNNVNAPVLNNSRISLGRTANTQKTLNADVTAVATDTELSYSWAITGGGNVEFASSSPNGPAAVVSRAIGAETVTVTAVNRDGVSTHTFTVQTAEEIILEWNSYNNPVAGSSFMNGPGMHQIAGTAQYFRAIGSSIMIVDGAFRLGLGGGRLIIGGGNTTASNGPAYLDTTSANQVVGHLNLYRDAKYRLTIDYSDYNVPPSSGWSNAILRINFCNNSSSQANSILGAQSVIRHLGTNGEQELNQGFPASGNPATLSAAGTRAGERVVVTIKPRFRASDAPTPITVDSGHFTDFSAAKQTALENGFIALINMMTAAYITVTGIMLEIVE